MKKKIEELEGRILELEIELQNKEFLIWDLKAEVDALHKALEASHNRILKMDRPSVRI